MSTKLTNTALRRIRHKPRRKPVDDISFEEFVLKNQILQSYRDMMRTLQKIPDESTREEVHDFVKGEFQSSRNVSNVETRRSLLIGGIRQFQSLANSLGISMPTIDFSSGRQI
ncbi:lyr motif-containing protein 2 [Brettanomyces bruxellensis AWRI1499]|nr:lyr motif-containing protein 2 [Brettanomyces bruxellensis AWRI1499]